MPRQFSLKTGCKVNLNLRILRLREDGYHDIESLFYPLSRPADYIEVIESKIPGMSIKCCPPELENRENILCRCYDMFAEATGFKPGLMVYLQKNVPFGSGLGGGSANAAAMLQLLNKLAGSRRLPRSELSTLGMKVGADVPFFMINTPAWVSGIGEQLLPAHPVLTGLKMVLVCPEVHVDTAWAYREWDEASINLQQTTFPGLTIKSTKDNASPLEEQLVMSNAFENVVFRSFPEIGKIKTLMLEYGAAACVMSGSGSSLVALFRSQDRAFRACALLDRQSIQFYYYNL